MPLNQERIDRIKANAKVKLQEESRSAQHGQTLQQGEASQKVFINAMQSLVQFLQGHTTKTEITNHLTDIGTPDVLKAVAELQSLREEVRDNKVDLGPVVQEMQIAVSELKRIPKEHPDAIEQREDITVTNLGEVAEGVSEALTTPFERFYTAIKDIQLSPQINVDTPAPVVNVPKTDLKPLEKVMGEILKAQKAFKIPETKLDTKDLADEVKKSNKYLKEIADQPRGGSGGSGGHTTPYQDDTGAPKYVELENGAVPTTGTGLDRFSINNYQLGTVKYVGKTSKSDEWLVQRIGGGSIDYATVVNNDTVASYTAAWGNKSALTYGRYDEAF